MTGRGLFDTIFANLEVAQGRDGGDLVGSPVDFVEDGALERLTCTSVFWGMNDLELECVRFAVSFLLQVHPRFVGGKN